MRACAGRVAHAGLVLQHDREGLVLPLAARHEIAVARLEDVQREPLVGQQHDAQREQGQVAQHDRWRGLDGTAHHGTHRGCAWLTELRANHP